QEDHPAQTASSPPAKLTMDNMVQWAYDEVVAGGATQLASVAEEENLLNSTIALRQRLNSDAGLAAAMFRNGYNHAIQDSTVDYVMSRYCEAAQIDPGSLPPKLRSKLELQYEDALTYL